MIPHFLTELELTPEPDGLTWVLDASFGYASALPGVGTILVPAGFVTDLASVPRLFWNIFPPFGKYTEAAVIHDWIYKNHAFPRATCDRVLLEAMKLGGTSLIARQTIYWAVRLFGWGPWGNEQRKPTVRR